MMINTESVIGAASVEDVQYIPSTHSKLTRQRIRAAQRSMTYHTGPTGNTLCDVVLLSKRTRAKQKRLDKRRAMRVESKKIEGII
jgi:hypothetical protein